MSATATEVTHNRPANSNRRIHRPERDPGAERWAYSAAWLALGLLFLGYGILAHSPPARVASAALILLAVLLYTLAKKELGRDHAPRLDGRNEMLAASAIGLMPGQAMRLVIVPHDVARSPQDFHTLLTTEDVTVLSQTPSAFYALQTADVLHSGPERQLKLHTVVFGGEALEPQRLRTWMQGHPGLPRLINMYGITEITVHASLREISPADAEAAVRRYGEAGASPHVNVGCRQE